MKQPAEWRRKARLIISGDLRPHFAPPAAALEIYAHRLEAISRQIQRRRIALILGATPELADLTSSMGWGTLRIDCNPAMLAAADLRLRNGNRSFEQAVVADWLKLPLPPSSVDLVLGDAALNNIPHEMMPVAISSLRRVCRSGAKVLMRQIVLPDQPVPEYELEAVLAARRQGRIDCDALDRVLRFYSFNVESLDRSRHLINAERVFAAVDRLHSAGRLDAQDYEFLRCRFSAVQHTIYTAAEQVQLLTQLGDVSVTRLPETVFYHRLNAIVEIDVS